MDDLHNMKSLRAGPDYEFVWLFTISRGVPDQVVLCSLFLYIHGVEQIYRGEGAARQDWPALDGCIKIGRCTPCKSDFVVWVALQQRRCTGGADSPSAPQNED
jgi:hypothetical protein